jgi:hypothetical protein
MLGMFGFLVFGCLAVLYEIKHPRKYVSPMPRKGSNKIKWQGGTVEVIETALSKNFWLTALIEVYVHDECILKEETGFKTWGENTTDFKCNDQPHKATFLWMVSKPGLP